MKKFLVIFLFLLIVLRGNSCYSNQIDTSLNEKILETFFYSLIKDSTAGYVLFGERPVYLCTLPDPFEVIPGTDDHKWSTEMWAGINTWKSFNICPSNYILKEADPAFEIGSGHEFLIINKSALLANVDQNISLFRSRLGINTTSAEILRNLINPRHNLTSLFKGQHTLLAIIFGYGTNNGMIYERGTALINAVAAENNFPYLEKPPHQNENELVKEIQYANVPPSMGFTSIKEEVGVMTLSLASPSYNLDGTATKIPFTYLKDSTESQNLLLSYKQSQKTLDILLKSENFLEQILSKFETRKPIKFTENKEISSQLLAKSIWKNYLTIFPEEHISFQAFLNGMKKAESGDLLEYLEDLEFLDDLRGRRLLFPDSKNRYESTENSLKVISNLEHINRIDKKIYFRTTIQNHNCNKKVSNITDSVSAYLLVQDQEGKVLLGSHYLKPPETFKLSEMIIGLSHGIQGMYVGETREIWIHPDYIYGIDSNFALGKVVKVTFKLVDLQDGTETISNLVPSDAKLFQISNSDWNKLLKNYHEYCGYRVWNFLNKDKHFSFADTLKQLNIFIRNPIDSISLSREEIDSLIRFYWQIHHKS